MKHFRNYHIQFDLDGVRKLIHIKYTPQEVGISEMSFWTARVVGGCVWDEASAANLEEAVKSLVTAAQDREINRKIHEDIFAKIKQGMREWNHERN